MEKTQLSISLTTALGIVSLGIVSVDTQAAVVSPGDKLSLDAGVEVIDGYGFTTNITGGSWFAMDLNGDSNLEIKEKVAHKQGTTGIIIGQTTPPGASHRGWVTEDDSNEITAPWFYFTGTGSDYVTTGITGDTTNGLDFSGWTVTWDGIPAIPMGAGAWNPINCIDLSPGCGTFKDGVGNFIWGGTNGGAYTLDYTATVPKGDPSGFGGVPYYLHLEGKVSLVPIPAALWLFGSGVLGLMGTIRRRKATS